MNSIWIARDKNGYLYAYAEKPDKDDVYSEFKVANFGDDFMPLRRDLLPEVTYDNSPVEVELVIKEKEK